MNTSDGPLALHVDRSRFFRWVHGKSRPERKYWFKLIQAGVCTMEDLKPPPPELTPDAAGPLRIPIDDGTHPHFNLSNLHRIV